MSQIMMIGILIIAYMGYLAAGIHYGFAVGWLDWISPFIHFDVATSGSFAPFVAPLLALAWCAFLWYQKSMIGEA